MSDDPDKLDASLSVEASDRIDRICLEFEEAWQSEQTPHIKEFLCRVEGVERPSLFRYLLQLDLYYRRQHGSDPLPSEYDNHFPEWTDLIHAEFLASAVEDDDSVDGEKTQLPTVSDDAVGAGTREERDVGRLICPKCGKDLELSDRQQQQITCANCGSTEKVDPKATSAYPLLPKTIGRFQIIERLGQGSFGVVYKAHDPELDMTVAIKIARPETLDMRDKLARFLREARSAARLKHPHIVQAHDIDYENRVPYIVSEFIEGMTLDDRLSGPPLSFPQSAELVAQIADALDYAHREKVIHRDVKPSNILIDEAGKPYLTDFGLAFRVEKDRHQTDERLVYGTPAYMSPEQARGESQNVDARTDLYSLGVVLYELLTGELPFRGKRRMLLHQVQHEEPPPPRRLNDKVPRDLETICLKCLEKDPGSRYPSGRALQDELCRYPRGEPILARPVSQVTRVWRWCYRNKLASTLITGIVLLIVLLSLFVTLWALERRRAERERFEAELTFMELNLELQILLWQYAQAQADADIFQDQNRLPDSDVTYELPDLVPAAIKVLPDLILIVERRDPQMQKKAVWFMETIADALGMLKKEDAEDAIPVLEDTIVALERVTDEDSQDLGVMHAAEAAIAGLREAIGLIEGGP